MCTRDRNKFRTDAERRIVDMFIGNNPNNKWIAFDDIARYSYETNKPQHWMVSRVNRFLCGILDRPNHNNSTDILIERRKWDGEPSYRLLDPSLIKERIEAHSLEIEMINIVKRYTTLLEAEENERKECENSLHSQLLSDLEF